MTHDDKFLNHYGSYNIMERSLEYDLDFFYKYPRIEIGYRVLNNTYSKHIIQEINKFSNSYDKFYIISVHEIIESDLFNDIIKCIDILNSKGKEVYISMTTSTRNEYLLHPLISLLHYKEFDKVPNSADETLKHGKIHLMDSSLISSTEKNIKAIISVKRKNEYRDLFFDSYKSTFDGVFRYLESDINKLKDAKPFTEIMSEYSKSLISFIFETKVNSIFNPLTEKIIFATLNKTLPILFLTNSRHLTELENLGFYFLNRDIGYSNVDGLSLNEKVELFSSKVDLINNMKFDQVKSLYNKHIENINNNFRIINDFISIDRKMNNYKLNIYKAVL